MLVHISSKAVQQNYGNYGLWDLGQQQEEAKFE